jgi:hypothetical protein
LKVIMSGQMERPMRDQMREMRRDTPPGTARFAPHHA